MATTVKVFIRVLSRFGIIYINQIEIESCVYIGFLKLDQIGLDYKVG